MFNPCSRQYSYAGIVATYGQAVYDKTKAHLPTIITGNLPATIESYSRCSPSEHRSPVIYKLIVKSKFCVSENVQR